MKTRKTWIYLVLFLLIFGNSISTAAEEQSDPSLVSLEQGENGQAHITLYPSKALIQNGVTTLQLSFQVTAEKGGIDKVQAAFGSDLPKGTNITEYTYQEDSGILKLYLSGYQELFQEGAAQVKLGTVTVVPETEALTAKLSLNSVDYVDQSHIQSSLSREELGDISCLLEMGTLTPDPDPNPGEKPDDGKEETPQTAKTVNSYQGVLDAMADSSITEITLAVEDGFTLNAQEQKTIFSQLQGTERSFVVEIWKDGRLQYSFRFQGTTIQSPDIAMSFLLKTGTDRTDILSLAKQGAKNLVLELAHSGPLPGPCEVKVFVGNAYQDGESLVLYYYNPQEKLLELTQKNLIVTESYLTMELTHCSEYLLTNQKVSDRSLVSDNRNDTKNSQGKTETAKGAKTGDNMPLAAGIGLSLLSFAILLALFLRKRKIQR